MIGAKNDAFTILDKATGNLVHPSQLYPKDLNNFSPRVSLAYDLTGKGRTVVRAGWGVFYAFSRTSSSDNCRSIRSILVRPTTTSSSRFLR